MSHYFQFLYRLTEGMFSKQWKESVITSESIDHSLTYGYADY